MGSHLIYLEFILLITFQLASANLRLLDIGKREELPAASPAVYATSYNISLPVDHFNASDKRTFNNRYWVRDTYYKPGGPVFFYDVGESAVNEGAVEFWLGGTGTKTAVMQLAQKYNGMAIMWEHRYFGLSFPVPLELRNGTAVNPWECSSRSDCSHNVLGGAKGYKYLTVEQALEDAVYFAHNFRHQGYTAEQQAALNATRTPWVWLGGSYPGTRAALIRQRNPETFYASWAASAPVQVKLDGSSYFKPIQRSMNTNCSADIVAAINYADEIMSGSRGAAAFNSLQKLVYTAQQTASSKTAAFKISEANGLIPKDIANKFRIDITNGFQNDLRPFVSDRFCEFMQTFNPSGKPLNTTTPEISILNNPGDGKATSSGLNATYNASVALNAFLYAGRKLQVYNNPAGDRASASAENSSFPAVANDPIADRNSWIWLVNSEFGVHQGSNPAKPHDGIISRFYNLSVVGKSLKTFFYFPTADIPTEPNVTAINRYGGWNMRPSNVMFTNGEFDPWRAFGVMSQEVEDGAPQRKITEVVPKCNQPPPGDEVFGLLHPGVTHAKDHTNLVGGKDSPFERSMALFSKALDVWLPCFGQVSAQREGVFVQDSRMLSGAKQHGIGHGQRIGVFGLTSALMAGLIFF